MTSSEIKQAIALLKGCYPRQELTKATIMAYSLMLSDLDFADLKRAVTEHAAESVYFPAIAELRKRAIPSDVPELDEAWGEVLDQIRREGAYGTPSFSHPAIKAVVNSLGWRNLCLSENAISDRAQFGAMFKRRREIVVREQRTQPLLERAERHPLAKLLSEGGE